MTNQQHPITPPPELVKQWASAFYGTTRISPDWIAAAIATQAAQWGADQELKACGRWLEDQLCMPPDARADVITQLNGSRRPKPPSLKEEARQIIDCLIEGDCLNDDDAVTLLRVLEAFND